MAAFKNLKELMTRLSDEKVCRVYLEQIRWNGSPVCPFCSKANPYKLKDGKTYRCKNRECRKDFTVTVGTIFENSKVDLSTWVAAIYLVTAHKKGISSCQLARDLGITQKTAWFVLHRIRYMMGEKSAIELDNTVEVDEVYAGGKWKNRSKYRRKLQAEGSIPDDKIPIMGLVQRDGKATLQVIKNTETFKDLVHSYVKPSATIITDAHLSYRGLAQTHSGHVIVNHTENQYVDGIYHTNTVEGFFSMLRRSIYGIYHHCSPKHLQKYCDETSFRYNSRKIKDSDRFVSALAQSEGRLTYKNLIKKP